MLKHRGFTLIEVIVALAIVAILTAVALPMYQGYIQSGRQAVANTNLQSLKLAEEDFFADNGVYWPGTYPPGGPGTLTDTLGWFPNLDGNEYTYTVSLHPCASGVGTCYTITVVGFGGKVTVTDSNG